MRIRVWWSAPPRPRQSPRKDIGLSSKPRPCQRKAAQKQAAARSQCKEKTSAASELLSHTGHNPRKSVPARAGTASRLASTRASKMTAAADAAHSAEKRFTRQAHSAKGKASPKARAARQKRG
jgi:hypothetical protein